MTYTLRQGSRFGHPAAGHFRTDPNISTFDGNAIVGAQDDEFIAAGPPSQIRLQFQSDELAS
jgi:hypothetical protein